MLELTTEKRFAGYLVERGWIKGGFCQVEMLGGGVSNVVFRVKTFNQWYVLKQSRPQRRTADPWFSDVSCIFREIDVMRLLAPRLPGDVIPEVLFRDDENFAFLMSHAVRRPGLANDTARRADRPATGRNGRPHSGQDP